MKEQGNAIFVFQVGSSLFSRFEKQKRAAPAELALQAVFTDRGLCQLSLYRGEFFAPLCHGLETLRQPARAVERFELLEARLLGRLNGVPENMEWREFDLRGQPEFHARVWKAMHAIPFGRTATYGEIARAAGSPRASRACGQACGANPILLFIPCHRVVSSSGLGGFGCGLEWKKRFLALEGVDWRTPGKSQTRNPKSEGK
ncbi:MAG: MGMT family protein [Planctomycetota bacterium]|nr:MGMT family protein [Planctomycetota bacterium]